MSHGKPLMWVDLFDLSRGDGLGEACSRGHLTPVRNHNRWSIVAGLQHTWHHLPHLGITFPYSGSE